MIDKLDKSKIKSILQDDRWLAVEKFFIERMQKWNNEQVTGSNAFEELRMLHKKQGKVEAVNELLDVIQRQAFED